MVGVCESQAPAQGCGNFYAGRLFSTLLFYLSPASPLELIWDLERLSLHVRTQYLPPVTHTPVGLLILSVITEVPLKEILFHLLVYALTQPSLS